MIDIPKARLRLEKLIVEIMQHNDGIDPATFKFFLMEVCTTDSLQINDIDEAAVGIATLLKNIRQHERSDRRKRIQRTDLPDRPVTKRALSHPLRSKSRIARIPGVHHRIRSKKSQMDEEAEEETPDMNENTTATEVDSTATGVAALMQSSAGVTHTYWQKCTSQLILVDQMHIPVLLILLWLLLGTLCYFFVQGWSLGQSFYFMVQVSRVPFHSLTSVLVGDLVA